MKNNDLNRDLDQLLTKYISHLEFERRLSLNTVNSYLSDLTKYINFLKNDTTILNINRIDRLTIRYFIKKIANKNDQTQSDSLNNKSIARLYSSIRGFHQYLLLIDSHKKNTGI